MHILAELDRHNRPVRIIGEAHDRYVGAQTALTSLKAHSTSHVSVLPAQEIVIEQTMDPDSLELLEKRLEGYDPYNKRLGRYNKP